MSNYDDYKAYVKLTLGSSSKTHFSSEDLLVDVDEVNINRILKRQFTFI